MRRLGIGSLLALGCFIAYAVIVPRLFDRPRAPPAAEMQVALPRFVQVLMAGGDRYLAANLAGFRALVSTPHTMAAENFHVLGIVQSDAAWLNPAHEDNYYIAAAILPWYGEVDATDFILRRSTQARPFDWQPPFYLAFNSMHFRKNPVEGAKWLLEAAHHVSSEIEQIELEQLAALWVAKGEDAEFAIRMHRSMASGTQNKGFARFLERRATRLENLLQLNQAVEKWRAQNGRVPAGLEELVARKMIGEVPSDPFGGHYFLAPSGKVQVGDGPPRRGPGPTAAKEKL